MADHVKEEKQKEAKCESNKCDGKNCDKRHPRQCRFYNEHGRCKFGEECLFNHVEELKVVKEKLDLVVIQMTENFFEIKLLLEKLELSLGTILKEVVKENGVTIMDDEQEKPPGIITEDDSGIDAISQCSPDGND